MKLIISLLLSATCFAAPPVVYKFDAPLVKTGENMGTRTISIPKADASHNGYLSSSDWVTFSAGGGGGSSSWGSITGTLSSQTDLQSALNGKQSTLSAATGSVNGYLTSTDWNTFNNKQSALSAASSIANGYLTSTDWNTFNGKQDALSLGNLTDAGTDGIIVTGGTGAVVGTVSLAQHVSDSSHNGYLSSSDWSTFNSKQGALSQGNLTEATSSVLTITGGTSAIIGSGLTLQVKQANTSQAGYLSSTDWNTFNNKGSGSVTAVSVASSNGFTGSSSGGATPALTLTTSITGLLKGNGTAISAAVSQTDYGPSTTGLATGILKNTTSTGAHTIAVAADFPTLNQDTSGTAAGASGVISGFDHETYTQCTVTRIK